MVNTPGIAASPVAPLAPRQPNLYAHGAPQHRKFLYEEQPLLGAIQIPDPGPALRPILLDAINRLNALRHGHASRDCGTHDFAPEDMAAISSIGAISLIAPRIPAQIFPLSGGGIQLEWHHGPLDIEIECLADGSLYIYLALGSEAFIDEQATDGYRITELLRRVGKELDNATTGHGVEPITFYS